MMTRGSTILAKASDSIEAHSINKDVLKVFDLLDKSGKKKELAFLYEDLLTKKIQIPFEVTYLSYKSSKTKKLKAILEIKAHPIMFAKGNQKGIGFITADFILKNLRATELTDELEDRLFHTVFCFFSEILFEGKSGLYKDEPVNVKWFEEQIKNACSKKLKPVRTQFSTLVEVLLAFSKDASNGISFETAQEIVVSKSNLKLIGNYEKSFEEEQAFLFSKHQQRLYDRLSKQGLRTIDLYNAVISLFFTESQLA